MSNMDSLDVKKWHLNRFSIRERERANLRRQNKDVEREIRRHAKIRARQEAAEAAAAEPKPVQAPPLQSLINAARFSLPVALGKKLTRRGNARGR